MIKTKKTLFYILSFTWGLPLTLVGLIVAMVLRMFGYKPYQHGYCFYFEIGENWGGLELGVVFLTNKNPTLHIKNHEYGHALQNCIYGFFMPFIVCIPSMIRYWHRKIRTMNGLENKAAYDDIWFEGQASKWGSKFYERWNKTNDLEGKDI